MRHLAQVSHLIGQHSKSAACSLIATLRSRHASYSPGSRCPLGTLRLRMAEQLFRLRASLRARFLRDPRVPRRTHSAERGSHSRAKSTSRRSLLSSVVLPESWLAREAVPRVWRGEKSPADDAQPQPLMSCPLPRLLPDSPVAAARCADDRDTCAFAATVVRDAVPAAAATLRAEPNPCDALPDPAPFDAPARPPAPSPSQPTGATGSTNSRDTPRPAAASRPFAWRLPGPSGFFTSPRRIAGGRHTVGR